MPPPTPTPLSQPFLSARFGPASVRDTGSSEMMTLSPRPEGDTSWVKEADR